MKKNTAVGQIALFLLFVGLLTSFTYQKIKTDKFILIGKSKAIKPLLKGKGHKLQVEAYNALEKMKKDALKKGIKIRVISAYRSFEHQNNIWNRKYKSLRKQGYSVTKTVKKIIEYTAIPGTSRHHWGTEVDLSNHKGLNNNLQKDKNKYEKWMNENAHKYGFYLAYTNNKFRKGYKYESWHYSYRSISKPLLIEYLKLDIIKILKSENIAGKSVFTTAFIQKYIDEHVLGINDYLY